MKQNQQRPDAETRRSHIPGEQEDNDQQTGSGIRNDNIRENPDRAESGASTGDGGLGEQTEKEGGLGRNKLQPPVE
jgi:hypothetical protein